MSSPLSSDFLSGISALINASRTSTTKGLWQMRAQERKEMTSHLHLQTQSRGTPITPSAIAAHAQAQDPSRGGDSASSSPSASPSTPSRSTKPSNPFPPILPLDSFWSVSLPFDSELSLYDDYVRFDGGVRFERILEDLDAFAGNVAHLHVKQGTQKLAAEHARKRRERAASADPNDADADDSPPVLPDMQIVTASVDGIVMNPRRRFPMDKFLAMQGCVTWVGSSSMEIWIEMRVVPDPAAWARMSLQEKLAVAGKNTRMSSQDKHGAAGKTKTNAAEDDGDSVILNAFFLMVARDTRTQKAAFVPPLDVARMQDQDRARFERGEASAIRRKREAATSLQRNPPTPAEIGLIHSLLMSDDSGGAAVSSNSLSSIERTLKLSASNLEIAPAGAEFQPGAVVIRPKSVPMLDTEMSSAAMTQPQDRNTNGKIFGGWLMSRAYELARCNAYLFCGANSAPFFIAVDHITFLRPVEIGSIISFRSKVVYSAGHPDTAFQMQVETLVHDLVGGKVFP